MSQQLAELLDCALDYISESNAIRMIGAREFYAEARAALAATAEPADDEVYASRLLQGVRIVANRSGATVEEVVDLMTTKSGILEGFLIVGAPAEAPATAAPEQDEPDFWWNGLKENRVISETETTNADIPLFAGYNPQSNMSLDLTAQLAAMTKERDKWKQMAEFQYALQRYPNELDLGQGALDAYMRGWNYETAIAATKGEQA